MESDGAKVESDGARWSENGANTVLDGARMEPKWSQIDGMDAPWRHN